MDFLECDECRVKAGSPILCADCLARRSELGRTGHCRPPRDVSPELVRAAQEHDRRMAEPWDPPPGFSIELIESPRPE